MVHPKEGYTLLRYAVRTYMHLLKVDTVKRLLKHLGISCPSPANLLPPRARHVQALSADLRASAPVDNPRL